MIPIQTEKEIERTSVSNEALVESLRAKVVKYLENQGFHVDANLRPNGTEKDLIRKIHEQKRTEQIIFHRNFLLENLNLVRKFSINSTGVDPRKIKLELREVKPSSIESRIFFWWNLAWWSLPFDKPIGRQMKFILWDMEHDAPFGLIGLQSPPLRSTVRDNYLGISGPTSEYWINQSMYAQRVGALPPYNDLLGGKMVALALSSNEIRRAYSRKYSDTTTLMKQRKIPSNLLFITTTSAFGKSSMYDRVDYNGVRVSEFIGYTSGAGTFHVSESLYRELLQFLELNQQNVKLGYGTGTSRKLRLIDSAFRKLKIPNYTFHNIKRGYYFFSHTSNLRDVINRNAEPKWLDRPFEKLNDYWKSRWCLPRSTRTEKWKKFEGSAFFDETERYLRKLTQPNQTFL